MAAQAPRRPRLHQRAAEARHRDQHGRQRRIVPEARFAATRDNVFVGRLWRSVKYEAVDLRADESVSEARERLGRYLDWYNRRRPHSSLDGRTPDQASFDQQATPPIRLAA
jgi:transposase InsO family protein